MFKALAWILVGALLAGGCFFLWQRKAIERGDSPEAVRARIERMDPAELERKIIAYKAAIEKHSVELERLTAPLRNVDYQQLAEKQTEAMKQRINECREAIEKLKKNLSAYEDVLSSKRIYGE